MSQLDGPTAPRPVHVYPTHGKEHDTDGGECWCSPEIEDHRADGGALLVVHREDN